MMATVADFIFGGSKITADDDCSHEIKRHCFDFKIKAPLEAFESVLMRQMNLEPIIQSEVSQKEKNKYWILAHIYGI